MGSIFGRIISVTGMASSSNGVVVWEFAENGRWIPYDPTVARYIEKHHANFVSINKTARPSGSGVGGIHAVNGTRLLPALPAVAGASAVSAILHLKSIDHMLSDYYVDFGTMEQIQKTRDPYGCGQVETRIPIQRSKCPKDHPLASGILWQWEDGSTWKAYDMEAASILEDEYYRCAPSVRLLNTCRLPYDVDLKQMEQTNIYTGFVRHVWRNAPGQTPPDYSSGQLPKIKASSAAAVGPSSSMTSTRHKRGLSTGQNSPINTRSTMKNSTSSSNSQGAVGGKRHSPRVTQHSGAPYPARTSKNYNIHSQDMQQTDHGFGQTTHNDCDIHKILKKYSNIVDEIPPDEECCICCEKLSSASGYMDSDSNATVIELKKCKHKFHQACLCAMYKTGVKDCSMQCPICKTIYGQKMGCCPKGRMLVDNWSQSLPGHRKCGTIVIVYDFDPGIQDERHPNPGQRYYAKGFPRQCFLPDNKDGKKILKLLMKAWDRNLTFTIGTSVTTGQRDTVVWNEIHHKTEFGSNSTGHGYPDPNYVDNVLAELAAQGITEDSDDDDSGPAQPHSGPAWPHSGPAQPPSGPAQPHCGPAQPHSGPGQAHSGPAQPHSGPGQAHSGPAWPHSGPAQPHSGPAQPHCGPAQPHSGPAQPHSGPGQAHSGPARPHSGPAQPHSGPAQPHCGPAQPHSGPAQPHSGPAQPHSGPGQAHSGPAQPHSGPAQAHSGPGQAVNRLW